MQSFSFAAIFQAFVILLVTVTQVSAGPISIQRRKSLDVYNPTISQPSATSVWKAGNPALVSWDTSNAPANISNQGHVVLKAVTTGSEEPWWKHLAGPFDLRTGRADVTIPQGVLSGKYKIILFGDSGNESPAFDVYGVSPSTGQQQPPSDNDHPFGPDDNSGPDASIWSKFLH